MPLTVRCLIAFLLMLLPGCSCSSEVRPPLSDLQYSEELLRQVTGKGVRHFCTYDAGRQQDSSAISLLLGEKEIWPALFEVRKHLRPGWIAFCGTRTQATYELVVARGEDQFQALRVARTVASKRGLTTEEIIERLKIYDDACDIDIYTAETNAVTFLIRRMPEDFGWFLRDLYDLSPMGDAVTEDTIAEGRRALETEAEVYIFWE